MLKLTGQRTHGTTWLVHIVIILKIIFNLFFNLTKNKIYIFLKKIQKNFQLKIKYEKYNFFLNLILYC